MKVSKTIIITFVTIRFVVLILSCVIPVAYFLHQTKWQYMADFETYGDSIKIVAYYCREFFEENVSADKQRYISYNRQSLYYNAEELDMPLEVKNAAARIGDAFDDEGYLDTIEYYEERISFEIINGRYALVYSFNDEKPKFVNSPEEDGGFSVKKIEDNWYHVAKNLSLS